MLERIEMDSRVCGGKPVIKGTRIPVSVVLDQIAQGSAWDVILKAYPELTRADLQAALLYAKASIDMTDIVPTSMA